MYFFRHPGDTFTLLVLVYLITDLIVLVVGVSLILRKGDPIKTIAWLLVLLFIPVGGLVLFAFFGQNFRKERLYERKSEIDRRQLERLMSQDVIPVSDINACLHPVLLPNLNIIRLLYNINHAQLSRVNEVDIYHHGSRLYEQMFSDLEAAERFIHIEYFIFQPDDLGSRLAELLKRKAASGVEVRFIFDGVGSWSLGRKFLRDLQESGVQAYSYLPVRFPNLTRRINYRNHRKIVVIDGTTGYVGGINVADKYVKGDPKLGFWRDTHLRIRGEAVNSLQTVFMIDWYYVSNQLLKNRAKYFPTQHIDKECFIQITASGPDKGDNIMQAYFRAISNAKKYIFIATPYFIPNEAVLSALITAAQSGVDVRLIVPGRSDVPLVHWCALSYVDQLLEAGVRVYLYRRGFIHAKILIVDEAFSSVGTANMDIRSFGQNLEVNAVIYDRAVNRALTSQFTLDIHDSDELDYFRWNRRSLGSKVIEAFARLFSPLF